MASEHTEADGVPVAVAAQRRFALQETIFGPSAENALSLVLMVAGEIDPARVSQAGRALLSRHRVLRTCVGVSSDGTVSARELPVADPVCRIVIADDRDRELPSEAWFAQVADEAKDTIGSLAAGPLLSFTIASMAPDRSAVILAISHAVTDASSNAILLAEFCAGYSGRPLTTPPCDYLDVVAAEQDREGPAAAALARDLEYLSGTRLDWRVPSGRGSAWARATLSPAAGKSLHDLARAEGTTLFAVLLAVIAERLAAVSGTDEMLVGATMDSREQLGTAGAVGPCLDVALFRVPVAGRPGWARVRTAIGATRDRLWDLLDEGAAPYDSLLVQARRERGRDLSRLCDVMVTYVSTTLPELHLAEYPVALLDLPVPAPAAGLTVNVGPSDDGMVLTVIGRDNRLGPLCEWLAIAVGVALEHRTASPAPHGVWPDPTDSDEVTSESGHHAPAMSEGEAGVAARLGEIWARVLRREVGPADNIYALGADSLTVARFCVAAAREGITVHPRDVMRLPSIAQLVRQDAYDLGTEVAVGFAASPVRYPLSQGQLGMVYASELSTDLALYSATMRVDFLGPFDRARVARAIKAVVARHPILRTRYGIKDRVPSQSVAVAAEMSLDVRRIESLSCRDQESLIEAATAKLGAHRYDWFVHPLATFTTFIRDSSCFVLLVGFHHSILDGHSERLLIEDFLTAYGNPHELTPLRSDFAAFVAAEQRALSDERQARFWREEVTRIRAVIAGERVIVRQSPTGDLVRSWTIEPGRAAALRATAHAVGCPVKSVLLAAHCRALGALTGQDEIVTGLSTHNRVPEPDGDLVLGNFVTMLPFRIGLHPDGAVQIRAVHAHESVLVERSRVPLATIQRIDHGGRLFWSSFSFTRFSRTPGLAAGNLRVVSVVSSVLSEDPVHVNFNEDERSGAVEVRVRLGPECPVDSEIDEFCALLACATREYAE
jgi:hypothetical protein